MDIDKRAHDDSDNSSEKRRVEYLEDTSIPIIPDPDAHLSPEEKAAVVSFTQTSYPWRQLTLVRIANSCGSLILRLYHG